MRLLAVALISAAALAYEVLLARLLAIIQWYHFAYMIISMALLGYGASGSFIALAQDRLRPRAEAAFATLAALFGVAALACFALAERLPFNPLELVWDRRQLLYLLALFGLLALPFFFAASCIGLALTCFSAPVGRTYRADLLGAGAGALGILGAAVPGAAGAGARAGRSPRPARRRARPAGRPRAPRLAGRSGARCPGAPARRHSGPLERAPALAVQEPEPRAHHPRRHRRGPALEPAGPRQRAAQRDRPVAPRARPEPRQHPGARRPDRPVRRRRGAEPDHRLRWRSRAARLSRPHPRRAALPPARAHPRC